MGRYLLLDGNGAIKQVRTGEVIADGELESETGECGDILQPDGTFITPEPVPSEPQPAQPTNQEINDNLMIIMNGLTDIYMATLGL